MKRVWSLALAMAVVASAAGGLRAADIGDPAGELKIKKWVKGDAVDLKAGKGKNIYVVEFWATWCGPCRESIPHLSELQAKYKDKGVIFVGVSDEKANVVRPFVEKQGKKMDYVVACDDAKATSKAYMEAYGQRGIPTAFIINKDGVVAWVGHPMVGFDEALEEVVSGKFDLSKSKEKFAKAKAAMAQYENLDKYFKLCAKDDETSIKKAATLSSEIMEKGGDDAQLMNALAWTVMTDKRIKHRDMKVAHKAARAAFDATEGKDPAIIDTYARSLFMQDKIEEAIEQQKRAISLCKDPGLKSQLEEALEEYEEKAPKKA